MTDSPQRQAAKLREIVQLGGGEAAGKCPNSGVAAEPQWVRRTTYIPRIRHPHPLSRVLGPKCLWIRCRPRKINRKLQKRRNQHEYIFTARNMARRNLQEGPAGP